MYISQRKQTLINKNVVCENNTRTDHDFIVGDKVMKKIRSEYKYKTLFKGPCEVFQTWTSRTVTLRTGEVTNIINTRNIKTYNDSDGEYHVP